METFVHAVLQFPDQPQFMPEQCVGPCVVEEMLKVGLPGNFPKKQPIVYASSLRINRLAKCQVSRALTLKQHVP